ncbi:MAG: FAD-dependent oxidoreductase [Rhodocyclales bacterium]|nr:FAD-dependent oxidoreductase [Rhodocyclales bacterium]
MKTDLAAPVLIVGTGAAGYGLLRALRRLDAQRPVALVTRDDGAAYSRMQLPSGMAEGREARDLVIASAEQMAHRLEAIVRAQTQVLHIDRARAVAITDRGELAYSRLVLATGSETVRPSGIRGKAADRILTVANLAEYRYFRHQLSGRGRVVLLGGSLIACEFADRLVRAGYTVALLEPGSRLLGHQLPALCAGRLTRLLTQGGVRVELESGIQRAELGAEGLELTLRSGAIRTADVVLALGGSQPRTGLARDAELDVRSGIVVDEANRCSDPHIFALGSCTELAGRGRAYAQDIDDACAALARTLMGGTSRAQWRQPLRRLELGGMLFALCAPPPVGGEWHEVATASGVTARFEDHRGDLRGFALLGEPAGRADELYRRLAR